MNTALLKTVTLGVAAALAATALGQNENPDEAEIRRLQRRQQEAWNQHDAKAYASLFTEDGDIVNVVGWWWKGRAEIEKKLTDAYAFVFKESTLTVTDVQFKFLTPEIAVAHVKWTMTGARTPKGIPEPQQGIQIQILQKQAGKWLIASFQNQTAFQSVRFRKVRRRLNQALAASLEACLNCLTSRMDGGTAIPHQLHRVLVEFPFGGGHLVLIRELPSV